MLRPWRREVIQHLLEWVLIYFDIMSIVYCCKDAIEGAVSIFLINGFVSKEVRDVGYTD